MIPGIDVSRHQGTIDWTAVARSGVRFVWMKATEGQSYVDPTFARNWDGARAVGLAVGAYHFAHPSSPAGIQARHFCNVAPRPQPGDLPPVLDIEDTRIGNPVQFVKDWCAIVEHVTGRTPVVYTYLDYWRRRLDSGKGLERYPLWIARYGPEPTGVNWLAWQYTSDGRVPGINGRVDRNWLRLSEEGFRRFRGMPDEKPWAMVKGFSPELGVLPHLLRAASPDAMTGPWRLSEMEVRVVDPANLTGVPGWSIAFGFRDNRFESVAGETWNETARLIVKRLGLC